MSKAEYATFGALLDSLLLLGIPAGGLQLVLAKMAAGAVDEEGRRRLRGAAQRVLLVVAVVGCAVAGVCALARERLLAVVQGADDDPWRKRLREAERRGEVKTLEALARDDKALSQPPSGLLLLGTLLRTRGKTSLAVEVLRCRRLIKGYSDTHSRGQGRFDRLMRAAELLRGDAKSTGTSAQQLASLRDAALRDAEGRALDERWRALQLPV